MPFASTQIFSCGRGHEAIGVATSHHQFATGTEYGVALTWCIQVRQAFRYDVYQRALITLHSQDRRTSSCQTEQQNESIQYHCFTKKAESHKAFGFILSVGYRVLYLDLNLDTAGEFELHQGVDSLGGRAVDVDQTLVV